MLRLDIFSLSAQLALRAKIIIAFAKSAMNRIKAYIFFGDWFLKSRSNEHELFKLELELMQNLKQDLRLLFVNKLYVYRAQQKRLRNSRHGRRAGIFASMGFTDNVNGST